MKVLLQLSYDFATTLQSFWYKLSRAKIFGTSSQERESPRNSIIFASFVLQEEIILL
jgi:hypothetical protein